MTNKIIQRITQQILKHKNKVIIFLAILMLGVFFLSLENSSYQWVFGKWDDSNHIGAAHNLFNGKGYTSSYLNFGPTDADNSYLIKYYNTIEQPIHEKGPIYSFFLGLWLKITLTSPVNWYQSGQIFNLTLASLLLIVYFYWAKNSFGVNAATFSIFVLAAIPFVFWPASRVLTEPLFYIFIIVSLILLAKIDSNKGVLALGGIIGITELIHPQGIILGGSILVLFLFKRDFKKALLFGMTWLLVLLPWMARNLILFGDFTLGLSLPVPILIKSFFSSHITPIFQLPVSTSNPSIHWISPITVFQGFLQRTDYLYNTSIFLIAISLIGIFGLLVWNKKSAKDKLDLKVRSKSEKYLSDLRLLTGIYIPFAIIGYYYNSVIFGEAAEPRLLFPIFLFIIPILFLGIIYISDFVVAKKKIFRKKGLMASVILSIIFVTLIISSIGAVNKINNFQYNLAENEMQSQMFSWLRNNIPENSNIGSNDPSSVFIQTGLNSVQLDNEMLSNMTYLHVVAERFDVNYVVYYLSTWNFTNSSFGNINLQQIYSDGADKVFAISYLKS
jgi:hypothetical protein